MTADAPRAQLIHIETDRRLGHEWDEWDGRPLPGNGDFSAPPGLFFRYAGLTLALVASGAAALIFLLAPRLAGVRQAGLGGARRDRRLQHARRAAAASGGEGRAAGPDPALSLEAGLGRGAGDRRSLRGAGVRRHARAARAARDPRAAAAGGGRGGVRAGHDDGAARRGGQAAGAGADDAPPQRAVPGRDARSGNDGAVGEKLGNRLTACLRYSESLLQLLHEFLRELVPLVVFGEDHLEIPLDA